MVSDKELVQLLSGHYKSLDSSVQADMAEEILYLRARVEGYKKAIRRLLDEDNQEDVQNLEGGSAWAG